MQDIALIVHFIGLAMGLGTSLAFMFLGIAGSRMEESERIRFSLNTLALTRMGHIGLALLIISGITLVVPRGTQAFDNTLFLTKMALVVILIVLIGMLTTRAKKAQEGNAARHLKSMQKLGRISLLVGVLIVIVAVYIVH